MSYAIERPLGRSHTGSAGDYRFSLCVGRVCARGRGPEAWKVAVGVGALMLGTAALASVLSRPRRRRGRRRLRQWP